MTRSATVRRVLRDDLCSGCGLCAGVAGSGLSMTVADGFNRPDATGPVTPQAETAIAAACPGAVVSAWPEAPAVHPYWGAHRISSTGHATDPDLRQHASSGGAISALLIHALETGAIDAVVQVVADPADPAQNRVVVSRTADEVKAASGSRYAPSSPLAAIGGLLDDGVRYGFVGKPCDVSALRRLGTVDPRVADRFPVILSFFCGGIPSRRATGHLLAAMGVAPGDLARFRYRGDGWPGLATATRHDGSVAQIGYMESWGAHLSKIVQFRCKICPDAVGGAADIACADAWYGDDRGYPLFEEAEGRSAVIARTPAGAALLDAAVAAGRMAIEALPIAELDRMQPAQARRKRLVASRYAALALVGRARPHSAGVLVGQAARRAPIVEQAKSLLGLLRRLPKQRRA